MALLVYDEVTAKMVIDYYTAKGFNPIAIASLLANGYAESGLRSNNLQNGYETKYNTSDNDYTARVDAGTWVTPTNPPKTFTFDSAGYGIFQWTSSGRKEGLYNYIKSKNVSISDRMSQIEYSLVEISTKYPKTYNGLLNATSLRDATILVMTDYERPAKKDDPEAQNKRVSYAEEFYKKYYGESNMTNTKEKILIISAGHGHNTPGKRIPLSLNPNDIREWDLNQRIATYLQEYLAEYDGIKVVRVDDVTGVKDIALQTRSDISDNLEADFYIAIHHNAAGYTFSGGGIVVFHYPLERNKKQANDLYNRLIKATGLKGNRSNPISATTKWHEVREPKADAILVEHGFMDSTVDEPIIITEDHARKCAMAECEFFVNMWGLKRKTIIDPKQSRIAEIKAQIEALTKELKALEET